MKLLSKDYKYRKQVSYGMIAIFIGVPTVLMLLPAAYFDNGPAMCISVLLFHKECFGCGITRAVQHMIHLDFDAALSYNRLAFFVFPVLAGMWLIYFLREVEYLYKTRKSKQ